ncbi:MAG: phage tail assembly protein [Synergistaceae bacterium]|nr:phage tail assembly protein [Synergistaceae bacterium]MBQ7220001.1 phage tail assembly protein [Synergistaceae bacterium]
MKITLSSPLKYKNTELSELDLDLEHLTGQDLIDLESSFTARGQSVQMFSQGYFAAIAAKSAHLPAEVIKSLPVKDFMKLTNQVMLFLADTVSGISLPANSEA